MTEQSQPTTQLAHFLAALSESGVPHSGEETASRHILDVLAGLFAGLSVPEVSGLLGYFAATSSGEVFVPATAYRCAAPVAAGATAALCHAAESDPIDSGTAICAAAMTVPAVLALCQNHPVTGSRMMAATVGGYEAAIRIGRAVRSSELLARGFWPTAVCGSIAAAAASAIALGLDAQKTRHAVSLAAIHAGGLATGGAEAPSARNLLCAGTVRIGVDAALCAKAGMVGAAEVFAGDRGFLAAFSEAAVPDAITEDLGTVWAIDGASQKAWPCALQAQSAIDALKTLIAEHTPATEDIAEIRIELPAAMKRIVDRPDPPVSHFMAAASLQFLSAALVLDGDITLGRLNADGRRDPAALSLMKRVTVRHTPEFDTRFPMEWPARVTVRGKSREQSREVATPPGHPARPLTFGQTAGRFRLHATDRLGPDVCERIVGYVDGLADASNVGDLVDLLCQKGSA